MRAKILIFIMICMIFTSCIARSSNFGVVPGDLNPKEGCVPPVVKIAYPVGIPRASEQKPQRTFPPSSWQKEASLPEDIADDITDFVVNGESVWLSSYNARKVYRYSQTTQTWKSYDTISNTPTIPKNFFVSRSGKLWFIDTYNFDDHAKKEYPLFGYFNATTDQFEFISDQENLLTRGMTGISLSNHYIEDPTGKIWFFGQKPNSEEVGLYSFDLVTNKAEKYLSLRIGYPYEGPIVASNGDIWFYNGKDEHLSIYSPTTNQVKPYNGLPGFKRIGGHILYLDRNNRLWVGNKGWLDFMNPNEPIWFEILASPVFVTDQGNFITDNPEGLRSKYGIELPYNILQSSNGWYWFSLPNGIVRLDPQKEEWCKITTGSSSVIEDQEGNLWIIVFGSLYKSNREP